MDTAHDLTKEAATFSADNKRPPSFPIVSLDSDVEARNTPSAAAPSLSTLPLEIKHSMWTYLLPQVNSIEHGLDLTSTIVAEYLAPIAYASKSLRLEVIQWYEEGRSRLGYKHSAMFGAVRPDNTTFTLTLNEDLVCCISHDTPYKFCNERYCPKTAMDILERCEIPDFDVVEHMKLVLIDTGTTRDLDRHKSLDAMWLVKRRMRMVKRLEVYVCRRFTRDDSDRLEKQSEDDGMSDAPSILLSENRLVYLTKKSQSKDIPDTRITVYPRNLTKKNFKAPISDHIRKAQIWKEW
jgi:hypothetical protein